MPVRVTVIPRTDTMPRVSSRIGQAMMAVIGGAKVRSSVVIRDPTSTSA